ncbi:uncharacterized protein G2W53_033020 [Senna tora]|uniref:Uncharacterized protein n=1 Tax=Senna tora TaxID=362788 RepID=A0A834WCE0_9FABA|nr:uncharacterized protein G2W53_033020 [Senna tora]
MASKTTTSECDTSPFTHNT